MASFLALAPAVLAFWLIRAFLLGGKQGIAPRVTVASLQFLVSKAPSPVTVAIISTSGICPIISGKAELLAEALNDLFEKYGKERIA